MSGIASLRSQNTQFSSSEWKYKLMPQFRKVNRIFFFSYKYIPTNRNNQTNDRPPKLFSSSKGKAGARLLNSSLLPRAASLPLEQNAHACMQHTQETTKKANGAQNEKCCRGDAG